MFFREGRDLYGGYCFLGIDFGGEIVWVVFGFLPW
jgi:hypothetical protein